MRKKLIQMRDRWLLATVVTVFFAVIYECFSHQVYSRAMLLAFLYPLLGGLIPTTLLMLLTKDHLLPGDWPRSLWAVGIAFLTLGSLFRGVLEIYGTTSRLSAVYPIGGWLLLAVGLASWVMELRSIRGKAPSYGK